MGDSVGEIGLDLVINNNGFNNQIKNMLGASKKAGVAVAAAFSVKKLADFGEACIDLGSELSEVQNVVNVTFGSMSKQVDQFAQNAFAKFGLSETMTKKFVGTFGSMSKAFGFSEKEAYKMGTALAGLSGDVSSFYNVSQEVAYTKLKSVFTGETESLKDLGVVMTQAALDSYALSNGFGKTTQAMSEAEKVALRFAFVQDKLSLANGDFARTSDGWANQIRILKLQMESFMSIIGQGLINVFLPVVKVINILMGKLISLAKIFKSFTEFITGKKITESTDSIAESADNISNSADNAASSETNLSAGIDKAAKSAKKAIAPFDELNVLQNDLYGNGLGGGGDIGLDAGSINSDVSKTENEIEGLKNKLDSIFIGINNGYNGLKGNLAMPIYIPSPIFGEIQDPVYKPNWGLDLPPVKAPTFEKIVAPEIDMSIFFQAQKGYQKEVTPPILAQAVAPSMNLYNYFLSKKDYQKEIIPPVVTPVVVPSIDVESNFNPSLENSKQNYTTTLEYMKGVNVLTLPIMGLQFVQFLSGVSDNIAGWGNNTAENYRNTLNYFPSTASIVLSSAALCFNSFFDGTNKNAVAWGESLEKNFGNTMINICDSIGSGLQYAWSQFVALKKGMGEKINTWFEGNKKWVVPAVGAGLVAATAAGIAISGGSLAAAMAPVMPYVATLANVGAYAKGAVIPANDEFLAILGDQKTGRNIETPENLLRQIFREEFNNGSNTTQEIVIKFEGSVGQFVRLLKPYIDKENNRVGNKLVLGGV